MSVKLKDLSFRRGRAMYEARRLSEVAHRQRRSMTLLEQIQFDRAMSDVISLRDQIDKEIRDNRLTGHVNKDDRARGTDYEDAVRLTLLGARRSLEVVQERAITLGNEAQGGFLTVPETWGNAIIAQVTDMVAVRRMASVYTVTSPTSFVAPTVEADFDDPDWTSEIGKIQDDASFMAGRRELKPHALSKGVKISEKLMRSSAGLAETVVIDRLSYKRRIAEEKGFLTGDGNQKPLGVFTPSVQGVPTSRDVPVTLASDETLLDATFLDSLIDAKFSMKAQYWRLMEWILHRGILKVVAKMKTGDGYYLYEASEDPDLPDMLLGRPINLSEYAPNALTSGGYLACLGDFKTGYAICDVLNQDIKILNELYIPEHQVGVIYRAEVDGMPVLGEAFARVKVA